MSRDAENTTPTIESQEIVPQKPSSDTGPEDGLVEVGVAFLEAEEEGESEKPKRREDLTYIQIDDKRSVLKISEEAMKKAGVSGKLGQSKSLEGARALIARLAEEGKSIDFILLDRDFFMEEGERFGTTEAGDTFLGGFKGMTEDPRLREALARTKIIMSSSHASDPKTMRSFLEISDRVIGGAAEKGMDAMEVLGVLGKAGLVERDEMVLDGCRQVGLRDIEGYLKVFFPRYGNADQEVLITLVNKARQGVDLAPLEADGPEMVKIVETLKSDGTKGIKDLVFAE